MGEFWVDVCKLFFDILGEGEIVFLVVGIVMVIEDVVCVVWFFVVGEVEICIVVLFEVRILGCVVWIVSSLYGGMKVDCVWKVVGVLIV